MKADLDPSNVTGRLYNQLAVLLDDMETGGDANLREKIVALLNDKRASDATLRPRITEAVEADASLTTRERIAALTAIARVLTIFVALRGADNEPDRGAAVRKYATAFQRPAANATAGRKASRRSAGRSAAIAAALADDDDDGDAA